MQDYIYKLNRADKLLRKCLLGSSVFMLAFLVSALSSSIFQKPYRSYADEIVANVRSTGNTLSMSSVSRVDLVVDATVDGAMTIAKDTLNIKSNSSSGYRVYISADGASEGDNSLKFGDTFSIAPTSGTVSNPAPLGTNTWGFAVPGLEGFDPSYSLDEINKSAKFAALPLLGHETVIASSNDVTPAEGTNIDIYFGINANVQIPAGTYSGNVSYSVVANSSGPEVNLISSSPNVTDEISGGEVITIATGLPASAEAVTAVAEVQGMPLATVLIGDVECTDVELSNSESGYILVTCKAPAHDPGSYDMSVEIPAYQKSYYYENALTYRTSSYSFFSINKMQDMTNATCAELPTPTKDAKTFATTASAVLNSVNSEGKATVIPQTTLSDSRDGKTYIVRKLADGNCWMAQNLELDFLGNGQSYSKDVETSTLSAGSEESDTVTSSNYKGDKVSGTFKLTKDDTDLNSMDEWTVATFEAKYASVAPNAEVYSTMVSNRESANSKYGWANNGKDGIRSYSYAGTAAKYSLDNWLYSTRNGSTTFTHEGTTYQLDKFSSASTGDSDAQRYGNLYNYTAATLGSGLVATTGDEAQDSICPRGWKLPASTGDDSFYGLIHDAYGIELSNKLSGHSDADANTNVDFNKLDDSPLGFFRTGYYNGSYGNIAGRTTDGGWWSSTSGTGDLNARYFGSSTGNVQAEAYYRRGNGYAVRCVAR